jgi:uncharacterized protein YabN with tetrapyrrole methylase and pyrophosphatase domain
MEATLAARGMELANESLEGKRALWTEAKNAGRAK